MQYQVTTMYPTEENEVYPKAAQACPNPRRLHILTYSGPSGAQNWVKKIGLRHLKSFIIGYFDAKIRKI